ncbi:hypothetical protein [Burkholderia ubonensis]|nr:hypothetical protein [Burkholderia ubonensis]
MRSYMAKTVKVEGGGTTGDIVLRQAVRSKHGTHVIEDEIE